MIVNSTNIDLAFKGFKTIYTDAFTKAPAYYEQIAMTVPSTGRDEAYGWLGQFPQMREWLTGPRDVKNMEAFGFTITNRKFESTVGISREDFADDRLGVFKPMFQEMGHTSRQHPDELIFPLLANGFSSLCYDGQYFFDTDHPSTNAAGALTAVSNMQAGTGPAWFLLDTSRAIRPIIWQEREKYDLQQVTAPTDNEVFMTDQYKFGIRARVNAGLGMWRLAFGSKAALTPANYAAARAQMMSLRGDKGRILNVRPTVMVVPPALELDARKLLAAENLEGGESNTWAKTAEIIVSPYLAA